jgi:hypothetical protein
MPPTWTEWSRWKRRNPIKAFVGEHMGSGLLSGLGSIIVYIIVFVVIIKYVYKSRDGDQKDNIAAALQLRSPYMYYKLNSSGSA